MRKLTFNGKSNTDYPNLFVKSLNRPVAGANRDVFMQIAGVDGAYLFNGGAMDDRNLTIGFMLRADNFPALWSILQDIANNWLLQDKYYKLIPDDEITLGFDVTKIEMNQYTQGGYLLAKVKDLVLPELAEMASIAEFPVSFSCKPFMYSNLLTSDFGFASEKYFWDDEFWHLDVEGYSIEVSPTSQGVGFESENVFWDEDFFALDTEQGGRLIFNNYGTGEILPYTTMIGTCNSPTIDFNGKSFTYNGNIANGTLILDAETRKVTLNGVNVAKYVTGDFPILPAGESRISVKGSNMNFVLNIDNPFTFV